MSAGVVFIELRAVRWREELALGFAVDHRGREFALVIPPSMVRAIRTGVSRGRRPGTERPGRIRTVPPPRSIAEPVVVAVRRIAR